MNTYRGWLRYELVRGRLSASAFQTSEMNSAAFIKARGNFKAAIDGSDVIHHAPVSDDQRV